MKNIKAGMKLIFDPRVLNREFLRTKNFNCGYVQQMDYFAGKEVTIKYVGDDYLRINEDGGIYNYDKRYFYTKEEIEEMGFGKKAEDNERKYTDFKVGDLVKFRDLKELEKNYIIYEKFIMLPEMIRLEIYKEFKDFEAVIDDIKIEKGLNGEDIKKLILCIKNKNRTSIKVSEALVEIVEENYVENQKKRAKEEIEKMCKKIEETDDIIEEMITKVDIAKFKKILASATAKRASNFQGIDKLLKNWAVAKKDLYLLFGKNLKLSKEIESERTDTDFKGELFELFKKFPCLFLLYREMGNFRRFYDNEYEKFSGDFEQYAIKIPNGTKLTKAISDIFKNKELDIEVSKIFENRLTKGILEVSIDPIDYLTMSFNNSGWKSCYTISENGSSNNMGCYVAGTLSYMCDQSSVIAYKHGYEKTKMKLGSSNIEDFSKNWRQVIYVDIVNYTMMCSREYPSKIENVSKFARELIENSISDVLQISKDWTKMKCKVSTMKKYIRNVSFCGDTLVYNDILHNNRVDGNMIYNKQLNNRKSTSIVAGSNVICPYCRNGNA